jgi:hypothetical protein
MKAEAMTPVFLLLAVTLLLLTLGPIVFRSAPRGVDWHLEVAFIRLDFPPEQRVVAQQLAAGLAEIVGMKIKQLKPEHNLTEIAGWAKDGIYAKDLITLFVVAFHVNCDEVTTFRGLVEKVARKKSETAPAIASAR